MNTRTTKQSALLLIAFCVLACSAGAQIRPGHRILNKVRPGMDTVGLEYFFRWENYTYAIGGNSTWIDSGPNGRTATQTTDVYAPAKGSDHVSYSGLAGMAVYFSTSADYNQSKSITHFFRGTVTSFPALEVLVCDKAGGNQRAFSTDTTKKGAFFIDNGQSYSDADFMDTSEHVYAVVASYTGVNTTNVSFYRDGVMFGSVANRSPNIVNGGIGKILGCYFSGNYPFVGKMKHFASYGVAKTPDEVLSISTFLRSQP